MPIVDVVIVSYNSRDKPARHLSSRSQPRTIPRHLVERCGSKAEELLTIDPLAAGAVKPPTEEFFKDAF